jgi:hypothetical protein
LHRNRENRLYPFQGCSTLAALDDLRVHHHALITGDGMASLCANWRWVQDIEMWQFQPGLLVPVLCGPKVAAW